jgi:FixJ family two-component response regulator
MFDPTRGTAVFLAASSVVPHPHKVIPLSKRLVAIVDDDASVRRALRRLLTSAGLASIAFASAREYLDAQLPEAPGCLVLDIQLGGMNGFELHQQLEAAGGAVPTIFITAHDDEATGERARLAGAAGYLRKPLEGSVLIEAIHHALGGGRGPRRE